MQRVLKRLARLIGAGCTLGVILALTTLFILQTRWFQERLRERVITAIEEVSGGRVELGKFSYNWYTLTARFQNLTIHGTEPAAAPPLFRASSIEIQLRILSVFERKVAFSSIVVEKPSFYILERRDGSTNIPAPELRQTSAEGAIQRLLNLRLSQFELRHGTIRSDQQEIPLDVRGQETNIVLTYDRRGPSYLAQVTSRQIYLNQASFAPIPMALSAQFRLVKNALLLETGRLSSGTSQIHAAGSYRGFNNPFVDLRLTAELNASDVALISRAPELRSGRLRLYGVLHRDPKTPFAFSGQATGTEIGFQAGSYPLQHCNVNGRITASRDRIILSQLRFSAPWGQLNGSAAVLANRQFSLSGRLTALKLLDLERSLFRTSPVLSGVAAGAVEIKGVLGRRARDLLVSANLDVAPVSVGMPVSGHIEVTYSRDGNHIELRNTQLSLPHTHLSLAGHLNDNVQAVVDTTNFDDLHFLQRLAGAPLASAQLPELLANGRAHFDGSITGRLEDPHIIGNVLINRFRAGGETWDSIRTHVDLFSRSASLTNISVDQGAMHASGNARVQLSNWSLQADAATTLDLQFHDAEVSRVAELAHIRDLNLSGGSSSGTLKLEGALNDPHGAAQLRIRNSQFADQPLDLLTVTLQFQPRGIRITNGSAHSGTASISFSGSYVHNSGSWVNGQLEFKADSNAFPVTALTLARGYKLGWNAQMELHGNAGVKIQNGHVEPTVANGVLVLRHVTQNNEALGDLTLDASTKGDVLYAGFSGAIRESHLKGNAEVHLIPGNPAKGQLQVDRIGLRTLCGLLHIPEPRVLPFEGFARGIVTFNGPLQQPERMKGSVRVDELQVSTKSILPGLTSAVSPALMFRNSQPIVADAANGRLSIRSFQLTGRNTNFTLRGSIAYLGQIYLDLQAEGTLDLRFVQLFQPEVQSSGTSRISASFRGNLVSPAINGTLEIQNASFFADRFPNGLTAVNGTVQFDRGRATIQKLTANSSGGTLSAGGFVDFSAAGPLVYRLDATAQNVRIRYANSISITANSNLRLTGTSKYSTLSGTATASRIVFTPNADVGTLLAVAAAQSANSTKQNDFLTGLQLDIRLESAPDLQVTTELSRDIQAEIDLRLRGSPEHPALLGEIVANQGDIKVFGGKYSINRGEIRFVNAARIEPVLDLDLQTEARGITVDVTIAGTLGKLNINYRSDPPLQPRDIIALLTVGRAPDTTAINPNMQTTADTSSMQYSANSVLGQAISPSSNRLSRLFGITNIKIDPLVQGITNVAQARLTLEQQISRAITVTYVTNLSQTSEQIFRVEWAFSPQYSLVALRDDNGEFGIDIQYKKRFK